MTFERGRGGRLMLASALACLAAACGDDGDNACLPAEVRGTCVDELSSEGLSCFDLEGTCTWRDADAGVVFEWANGARFEITGSLLPDTTRLYGADGQQCSARRGALRRVGVRERI